MRCLLRHSRRGWGSVCNDAAAGAEEAVTAGFRILSAYPIDEGKPCKGFGDNMLWIINRTDHSATTFLCRASIDGGDTSGRGFDCVPHRGE